MKLEYYVFFSSDAFFSLWPCSQPSPAFTPVVPFRNSTSHLLRPTDYSRFLFILLCFPNHLACCFSVVPRLRLKIYMRTLISKLPARYLCTMTSKTTWARSQAFQAFDFTSTQPIYLPTTSASHLNRMIPSSSSMHAITRANYEATSATAETPR